MTLRARLTVAFLAVVMGPVLVVGIFVAITVNAMNHSHDRDRLDQAIATTKAQVGAACARLQSAAETAAAASGTPPQAFVDRGLASAIQIDNAAGVPTQTTVGAPARPWAVCTPVGASESGPFTALAAVVTTRDTAGGLTGYVYAVQDLSPVFLAGLATSAGAQITIVNGSVMVASSQSASDGAQIAAYASRLAPGHTGERRSRYVRSIARSAGQPFDIVVAVPVRPARGLLAIVIGLAAFAGIAAVGAAWFLARTATRPLDEIAAAAERIAEGDLRTRVPVRHDDEIGHVGAAFNRLSREMQSYSTALTNSREQLRGNLSLIGDTLASTHDLPRMLHVILASAVSAAGARAGVVMLVDPIDGRLRVDCAEGFEPAARERLGDLVITPGTGLAGAVVASGVACRGRIGGKPDGGPVPSAAEPSCRTYLAAPLRSPAASTGVVVLYDRLGDGDFDDVDLRTVGSFAGHAAIAVDNVRAHAEAQRLSHTDPMTGLYNYRHLKDLIRREVDRSTRFGHTLCVIVLDLDRFKDVNDSHGHPAGDSVLVEFAARVRVEVRAVDLAFRYGGEEFVLLLPETDGLGGAALAQRLGASVRDNPFAVRGHERDEEIQVTVSIGVAVFPEHGQTGSQLLESADDALYAAKAAGRDTYRLATGPRLAADRAPSPAVAPTPQTSVEAPRPAVAETAPAGVGPGRGGFARWRGRGPDGSSGGASGTAPPPRQPQGR